MTWPVPSPEDQVRFLRNVQRLLAEGQFVASYKFALIHALADLAVLKGDDTGAPLEIDTKEIAAKFVELYWRQARPFQVGGEATGLVLQQNTGGQAEIISHIMKSQQKGGASLFRLKQEDRDRWSRLVNKVDKVVCEMPLWKLQTVGKVQLNFLYENLEGSNRITMKPGVAYCLRAFYELIRDLVEGAWVRFVQKVNGGKLGGVTDLGTFLFGEERASLEAYRPILIDVQKGDCLYCRKPLSGKTQVDHFVPWSRYPADLGHNFVLAHDRCNNAKSDFLAAENHLAAWVERNREHRDELDARLVAAALPCDLTATVRIARWVYQQTEDAHGQVWVSEKVLRHLGAGWAQCLSA
ncbi:MAG: HNH endonuclease [Gemmataceae bacterium]|nr:HNH endonuclease [Gemmataceae bacterium]